MKKIIFIIYLFLSQYYVLMSQCPNNACSENNGTDYNYDEWSLERDATVRISVKKNGNFYDMGSGVVINNYRYDGAVYILTSYHTFDLDGDRSLSSAEKTNIKNNTIIEYNAYCSSGGSTSFTKVGGVDISAGSGRELEDYILIKQNLTNTEKTRIFYAAVSSRLIDLQRFKGLTFHHPNALNQNVTVYNGNPINTNRGWKLEASEIVYGSMIVGGSSGGGNFKHERHCVVGINRSTTGCSFKAYVSAIYNFKNKSTDGLNTFNNVILNGYNYVGSLLPHNYTYKAGTSIKNVYMHLSNNVILTIKSSGITGNFSYSDGGKVVVKSVDGQPVVIGPQSNQTPSTINNGSNGVNRFTEINNDFEDDDMVQSEENYINIYPNPSSGNFYFNYKIKEDNSDVFIAIYDLRGSLINTVENTVKEKGEYKISWSAKEQKLESNIYIVKFLINGTFINRRLVFID